jgi:hypothetical protein
MRETIAGYLGIITAETKIVFVFSSQDILSRPTFYDRCTQVTKYLSTPSSPLLQNPIYGG